MPVAGAPGDSTQVQALAKPRVADAECCAACSLRHAGLQGALCMIDDGEVDWKIVAINAADPLADELNSAEDIERVLPHTIAGIREWFR